MLRQFVAACALTLQLTQWGVPVVCMPESAPMTACHEHATQNVAVIGQAQAHVACAELGMCATSATALPTFAAPGITAPFAHDDTAPAVAAAVPSNPLTPPSPPPQA